MSVSLDAKIAEVETLIQSAKQVPAFDPERIAVWKAIAADYRARMACAPNIAETEIGRRIDTLLRSKTPLGFYQPHLDSLAREVLSRWPVVKQSLEMFGEHVQQEERQ